MKKVLIILGCAGLLFGGILLLRGNSRGEGNPFSKSILKLSKSKEAGEDTANSDKSPDSGEVLGVVETKLPHEDLIRQFSSAREKREWREVLRLCRWFASLPPDRLLPLIEHMSATGQGILLGQMLEHAYKNCEDRYFRRELSRAVMAALEGRHMETLPPVERRETFHLLAVYGGADGASRLLSLMGTENPEVQQGAALALGKEGSTVAVPHLKLMAGQVDLDLSGIYAILALEKIGKRTETSYSVAETGAWKNALVRMIEFDSDADRVGESLVVLSRLHDRGTNEMLLSLLKAESSSPELRRKALSILAREGTEEDLENLPKAGELLPEIERTRKAIESRLRPR